MLRARIDPALEGRLGAEAILQETFLIARRRWAGRPDPSDMSPYAWLLWLARQCLIDAWRRERPKLEVPWLDASSAPASVTSQSPTAVRTTGVPRIAMMRYLACSDDEIARRLYEVVEEETEGLSTGSAGHIDLFVQFAASLGISREELDAAPLAPATAAHLYYVELVIHKYPWFVVMAAQIAAEGTAPPPMAALAKGLVANYNLSPAAVRFFTVHVDADEDHGTLAEEIAERYLQAPALQSQTREVGFRRLELLYDTWTIDGFAPRA